jgi:hypothetical protein
MEKTMTDTATLDMICAPSDDVVAREIEGDLIIVPLAAGIGDSDDELYTLNETGRVIWGKLDGARSLRQIASELANEYAAPAADLERDVTGLVGELLRRKIVVVK